MSGLLRPQRRGQAPATRVPRDRPAPVRSVAPGRRDQATLAVKARAVAVGALVAAEASLRRGAPTGPPSPGHRTLFVAGCPRSGTTWVMSMMQRHPLVIGTLESHAYRITNPVRRRGPVSPRAWASVFRDVEVFGDLGLRPYARRVALWRLAVAAASPSPTGSAAADRFIHSVFDHFARSMGANADHVLLEKTPGHLLWARTIFAGFPSARMIEVVRDGRDVCVSMQMRAPHVAWATSDRAAQIRTWTSYVEAGDRLHGDPALAGRLLRVRYEDLKADPRAWLARMLEFAGVKASSDEVDRIVEATNIAAYEGPKDGSTPKRKGIVGDWQAHFTDVDVELFEQMAGDVARRAGYPGNG